MDELYSKTNTNVSIFQPFCPLRVSKMAFLCRYFCNFVMGQAKLYPHAAKPLIMLDFSETSGSEDLWIRLQPSGKYCKKLPSTC